MLLTMEEGSRGHGQSDVTWSDAAAFKGGRKGSWPSNTDALWKLERARKWTPPRKVQSPADILSLAPRGPFQTSELKNQKKVNSS